jgi:hypothetical protein
MQAQLRRLAVVSELPNVTIRVLPFDTPHALAVDSFAILQFGQFDPSAERLSDTMHDVVSVEHLSNELYVQGETDTNQFNLAFRYIAENALSPERSRKLILEIAG